MTASGKVLVRVKPLEPPSLVEKGLQGLRWSTPRPGPDFPTRRLCAVLILLSLSVPLGCDPPPRPNLNRDATLAIEDELAGVLRQPPAPESPASLPPPPLTSGTPPADMAAATRPENSRTESPLGNGDPQAPPPLAGQPRRPTTNESTVSPSVRVPDSLPRDGPPPSGIRSPEPAAVEAWETWQALYLGGRHVGFSHLRVEPEDDSGEGNLRVTMTDQIRLRRGNSTVLQRYDQTTVETPDGQLRYLQAELRIGPAVTRYLGKVNEGQFQLQLIRGDKRSRIDVNWGADDRGPAAVQQSLRQRPLTLGESRSLRSLLPIRFVPTRTELRCDHRAAIAMPDGSVVDALEIEVAMTPPGNQPPVQSVIWTDELGYPIKTYNPSIDLVGFTTSRQEATAGREASDDILSVASVRVEGELENPERAAWTLFQLAPRGNSTDSAERPAIQPQPGQWVRRASSGAYQLFVANQQPPENLGRFLATTLAADQVDLRPNSLIDSDDAMIIQIARSAVSANASPKDRALGLAFAAHSMISTKGYAEGLQPASEVVRRESGDCTAHALLLAALLRSQNIPARIAVGLLYVPTVDGPRMVFHMWTLAWVDNAWLPLDATRPTGLASADRIILGTDHLSGGNEFELLANLVGVIGQYDIRIVRSGTQPLAKPAP